MKLVEDTQKQWSALGLIKQYAVILVGLAALGLAIYAGVLYWRSSSLAADNSKLKKQAEELQTKYDQKIGEAKAHELAAREEKAKADALIATIEAGTKNVKALDDKLKQAETNYESAKSQLGDCGGDCLRTLCLELRANGFTVVCPE